VTDKAVIQQSGNATVVCIEQVIGPRADSEWLFAVPWGLRKHLAYVDKRYGHPEVYITENGCSVPNESQIPVPEVFNDTFRVNYYKVCLRC
jgi:beta-glucosidase